MFEPEGGVANPDIPYADLAELDSRVGLGPPDPAPNPSGNGNGAAIPRFETQAEFEAWAQRHIDPKVVDTVETQIRTNYANRLRETSANEKAALSELSRFMISSGLRDRLMVVTGGDNTHPLGQELKSDLNSMLQAGRFDPPTIQGRLGKIRERIEHYERASRPPPEPQVGDLFMPGEDGKPVFRGGVIPDRQTLANMDEDQARAVQDYLAKLGTQGD